MPKGEWTNGIHPQLDIIMACICLDCLNSNKHSWQYINENNYREVHEV